MKIDGYTLQQAIREAKAERDQVSQRFTPSLRKFPDEVKPDPRKLAEQFSEIEARVAKLQVAQTIYNLTVKVEVNGQEITLLEAVKRVGGAGRLESMWRSAAAPQQDRYSYRNEDTRDKDAVVSTHQVPFEEAAGLRRSAGRAASALRAAIQKGNAEKVEVDVDLTGLLG
jgi:hypothetical protein